MGTTFPKDIMDCMKGCILSIFWPKKDIVDFMKKVGCTSRELMPESEYKELHRAEIVDKIFTNLEKRSDSGIGQFRCMLKELTEWNYFDPYYFQKLNKLSESEAKRNISHLKQLQEIRDYKIKQERQRQEEQERKRKDISISINELKEIFLNLFSGKDQNGKEINAQRRGYLFEEFLKKLFLNEGIEVTEPFKIVGEQIDGSIKYDGEHYIIEAKWHDKWSASDSLYQFAAKVEGKMYGRGVFISVNGFSPDSVQALTTGKALRTILVDGGDLVPITEGMYTLREMLDNKIKAAQTMGRIYVDSTNLADKVIRQEGDGSLIKLEEKLLEQYFEVIEKNGNTENQIQEFLEENTIFIPMPFLLNHYLHMNCVISKFKLGNEFVTDFAYLTKSSDYWEFVLVELEDAKKKIFTNDKENIYFHSEFNHAYDQITSWKAYVNKNREAILHQIDKLRVPLNENSVRFKYVLVIGRNAEKNNSEKRRAMFAEKSDNDIRVMTYDSLVSQCESVPYNGEKIILSTWKEQGFKIKKLPKQEISTSLFAYLKPEYLQISERDIEILKEQDYQIDIWLSGRALSYNDKYDAASLAERTTNPLTKAVLLAEAKNNK